jgi:putative copper resistance protein D
VTALLATSRALHFASLMPIFGAATYLVLLRRHLQTLPPDGLQKLFAVAATIALLTALLSLGLAAGQMSGDWRMGMNVQALTSVVRDTRFGHVAVLRIAGLAALWLVCVFQRPISISTVAILAAFALGALGLTSHAAAGGDQQTFGFVRAANDAAHLMAGSFWLGGLVVLAIMIACHMTPRELLPRLRLFSVWGTWAVAALVITGVANAASILPAASIDVRNRYFGLLLAKVALAMLMIGLAAANRWRVVPPMLSHPTGDTGSLARNIAAELALGVIVIALAGCLGAMPPR